MADNSADVDQISRYRTGNYLLVLAWAIEIIAASIGLFFAITRLLVAQETETDDSPLLVLVNSANQALPFIAVAIVELTKIPFATAFYRTQSKLWKTIFLSGLLILMVITFETFFTGFERSWSVLNKDISGSVNRLKELRETIDSEGENIRDITIRTEEAGDPQAILSRALESIESDRRANVAALEKQRDDLLTETNRDLQPLVDQKNELETERTDLKAERDYAVGQREQSLEQEIAVITEAGADGRAAVEKMLEALAERERDAQDRYEAAIRESNDLFEKEMAACIALCWSEREARVARNDAAQNNLDRAIAEIREERNRINSGAGASQPEQIRNARAQANRDIEDIRNDYRDRIDGIGSQIRELQSRIMSARTTTDPNVQAELDRYAADINRVNNNAQDQREKAQARYEEQVNTLSQQGATALTSQQAVSEARSAYSEACHELEEKILDNQIFRLAKLLGGKDIACEENFFPVLRNTFVIWFGSIALIISGTGTLLAFGGLVLKNPPKKKERVPGREPVKIAVRRALVAFRKRLNKPRIVVKEVEKEIQKVVEVVKEVPVDKVVFKEIPVEAVKKEVVHIPVYTNDPSLLGKDFEPQDEQ